MRTKISKVAKDLNVGVNTAVEFLRKHNIEVDEGNPNARIDSDAVDLLMQEFSNDKTAKDAAEGFSKRREHKKENLLLINQKPLRPKINPHSRRNPPHPRRRLRNRNHVRRPNRHRRRSLHRNPARKSNLSRLLKLNPRLRLLPNRPPKL